MGAAVYNYGSLFISHVIVNHSALLPAHTHTDIHTCTQTLHTHKYINAIKETKHNKNSIIAASKP